jgi:hypothetical protein
VILAVQAGEWVGWSSVTRLSHRPDQAASRVIDHLRIRIEELLLQVVQRCIIELELPLEGTVGQAPPALEHGYRLVEDLLKGHPHLSRGRCRV